MSLRSSAQPWYKTCTAAKIEEGGGYVGKMDVAEMHHSPYHFFFKRSSHAGYLPRGIVGIMEYDGRYGKGYIIATHNDATSVLWDYYIDERGLPFYGN